MIKRSLFICVILCALALSGLSQQTGTSPALAANVTEGKLDGKLMARQMPYRVVLPAAYSAEKEKRFPVIYLLHGLTGHYSNWTDKTKIAEYALRHSAIIVTPEGDNGWYSDSVSRPNDKYESYIVKELIPEIDAKYRTIKQRSGRSVVGLSMGGYGGLKFGLKYPELFSLAGSFSGALGAASFSEKNAGAIGKSLDAVFGPADSETRKANDIFAIIRNASPEKIKAFPFLYIDCGTEDFLIDNNRDFMSLLVEKNVPHEFRQLPGGHTWPYWDQQVQEFLRVSDKFLK
jgi:putative tributyrin esterase